MGYDYHDNTAYQFGGQSFRSRSPGAVALAGLEARHDTARRGAGAGGHGLALLRRPGPPVRLRAGPVLWWRHGAHQKRVALRSRDYGGIWMHTVDGAQADHWAQSLRFDLIVPVKGSSVSGARQSSSGASRTTTRPTMSCSGFRSFGYTSHGQNDDGSPAACRAVSSRRGDRAARPRRRAGDRPAPGAARTRGFRPRVRNRVRGRQGRLQQLLPEGEYGSGAVYNDVTAFAVAPVWWVNTKVVAGVELQIETSRKESRAVYLLGIVRFHPWEGSGFFCAGVMGCSRSRRRSTCRMAA